MEFINIETMLFFGKKIVMSLRNSSIELGTIYDMGKPLYLEVLEYLEENNEISEDELEKLKSIVVIFDYSKEDIQLMSNLKKEIEEGKEYGNPIKIDLIEKMMKDNLIEEKNTIRYLAHNNLYCEVIEWCENKEELFLIAKKYGSIQTQSNFNNYQTMKKLQNRLLPLGVKNKKIKI